MTDTERVPTSRGRRRGLHWLGLAIVVLLVFVVASELAGWRYLRGPLQSIATSQAGRDVTIQAPFRLHLFRLAPSIAAGGVRIAAPSWSDAAQFAASGPIYLQARWSDLLAWRGRRDVPLSLVTVSAQGLTLDLERRADGKASWQFGDGRPAPREETTLALPSIERLELVDSRIAVRDALIPLDVTATASLREGASVEEPGVRIDAEGRYRDSGFKVTAEAPGLMPVAAGGALEGIRIQAELGKTRLRFDGRVGQPIRLLDVVGDFAMEGPTLAELGELPGLALPATKAYAVEGWLSRGADRIEVKVKSASVGDSRLAADFQFEPGTEPSRLTGRLTGRRLQLQDLGPALGGESEGETGKSDRATAAHAKTESQSQKSQGKATGTEADTGGRVLPDTPLAIPSLKQMDADVQVALARFDPGTTVVQAMTDLEARIVLQDGTLEIRDLSTRVAGGRIAGHARIAPIEEASARWDLQLRWQSIELAQWLKQTQQQRFVEGRFDGALKLSGQGATTARMLASLDGDIRAVIRDGGISHQIVEILGLDAAQALGVTMRGDELLNLRCAVVDFGAKNGELTSRVGVIDTVDSTIFLDGTVGLADESLKLRIVSSPKDWSPLSLRSPVIVSGTFGDPGIGIDARPLALKALASIALAAVAPVTAIIPLMDFGKDRGDVCGEAIDRVRRVGAAGTNERADAPREGGKTDQQASGRASGKAPAQPPAARPPGDQPRGGASDDADQRPRDEGEPLGLRR